MDDNTLELSDKPSLLLLGNLHEKIDRLKKEAIHKNILLMNSGFLGRKYAELLGNADINFFVWPLGGVLVNQPAHIVILRILSKVIF